MRKRRDRIKEFCSPGGRGAIQGKYFDGSLDDHVFVYFPITLTILKKITKLVDFYGWPIRCAASLYNVEERKINRFYETGSLHAARELESRDVF